jgi:hypothetical protein
MLYPNCMGDVVWCLRAPGIGGGDGGCGSGCTWQPLQFHGLRCRGIACNGGLG